MDRLEMNGNNVNNDVMDKIVIKTDDDFTCALSDLKEFLVDEEHRSEEAVRSLFISKYEAAPKRMLILDMVGCMSAGTVNGVVKYSSEKNLEGLIDESVQNMLEFAEAMTSLMEC